MLKGTNRNFFSIFDYTTYTYDPDGSQSRRKLYTGAGLQLDEQFEYSSWRGLSWKYTRTDPNLLSGSDTWEYRYRYNAMGEREQKRETLNPAGDGTAANGYSWTYYLLGGNRQQLSVWNGLQTSDATFCSMPGGGGSYVSLYPSEYITYGGSSSSLTTKPSSTSSTQEYHIADHLGSNRVVMSNSGTVLSTADYEPFGKPLSGSTEDRKSFIDKERDEENQLGNFGVRAYDYGEGRFTSVDPLWEEFIERNLYQYSMNNPVIHKDSDGDSAIVVLDVDGAGHLGHIAILIGNEKDGWDLYSKNGTDGLGGLRGESKDPQDRVHFQNFAEFVNDEDSKQERYDKAFLLESTSKEDDAMRKEASEEVKEDYNVITNSCLDVVLDALEAGGFETSIGLDFNARTPNYRFMDLIVKNAKKVKPTPGSEL